MIPDGCESVYMFCICVCVCGGSKARGSKKCAQMHMHVSCVLCKRASLDLSLERVDSAKYHSTCSLACVCVSDSTGITHLGINIRQCISSPYAEIRKKSVN